MTQFQRKKPSKSIDQEIDDLIEATSKQVVKDFDIIIMPSKKGGPKLVHEGDRYLVDKRKLTTGKTYWKCAKPGCPGRLHSEELDPYSALEKAIGGIYKATMNKRTLTKIQSHDPHDVYFE
ncbi:hypothetical protein BpHYR1_013017 [Brachionus plicatilis]|uniref:FLYWCH-type domain-containing protein n=1 Tax=Brachionus plicatilis TaxID=10195 RepID=A0A3M7R209_BRAPC|nr:hypothetical protein BpHYR1_013017 [Brachionus plicatilis]